MVDIFKEGKEMKGNTFSFNEIEDQIQGTYVGKESATTKYGPCTIYEIKDEAGEYWNIWGKPSIDRCMKHIKFGQIIGFRLINIDSTSGFKDVKVIADPKIVDEEWMKENEMLSSLANAEEVQVKPGEDAIDAAMNEMTKDSKPEVAPSDTDQLAKIGELAKSKLGVDNPDEIQQKVMEATNMAWLPSNFKDIIEKLEALQ